MNILYEGTVSVYLQGENALLPTEVSDEQITYYVGSEETRLQVIDYRHESLSAANRVIRGENGFEFADIFNQSAQAKVKLEHDDMLEIELFETPDNREYPILWLGILEDNLMPNYDTEWEFLRPFDSGSTAIAVLIQED